MARRGKPDPHAAAIAARLRVFIARRGARFMRDRQRVSYRLFRLAEAAGMKGVRTTPRDRRHELFAEACARGFGSSAEAAEVVRVLAEAEAAASGSDSDPWRELRAGWAQFVEEVEAEGKGGGPDRDLWTFTLLTDALEPEFRRGARLLFREGAEPREGEIACVQTRSAGQIVRRVHFTPGGSVVLEAPNADPEAFRLEAVRFRGVVVGPADEDE